MAENIIEIIQLSEQQQYDGDCESNAIDEFIQQNSQTYDFSNEVFTNLFLIILQKRLFNKQWVIEVPNIHLLKVLQLVRLLTREKGLLEEIQEDDTMISVLSIILEDSSQKLSGIIPKQDISLNSEITIEILSICKRLLVYPSIFYYIKEHNMFTSVIDLISINHPMIIKILIDFLSLFFEKAPKNYQQQLENQSQSQNQSQQSEAQNLKEYFVNEFGQIFYISKIIYICEKFEESYKIQAINLLTKIIDYKIISDNFRRIRGLSTLMYLLNKFEQSKDKMASLSPQKQQQQQQSFYTLKISILNCMQKFIQRPEVIYDFKVYGIVPVLQTILKSSQNFIEISLIINILTSLILDDDLSIKIMDNGLDSITQLLLNCHPSNRETLHFNDVRKEMLDDAIFELELHCFRLLRFLFSIEKNRKIFKVLFPPRLLGIFIDIGNFVRNFHKYRTLTESFNQIAQEDIYHIEESIKQIGNQAMLTSTLSGQTFLGSYQLIELIGKGAFGTVFLAKKGENKYALKLISHSKQNEQSQHENVHNEESLQKYLKEVMIYKNLRHPNIVRYYESFMHESQLCIVMELVEGFNLSELIKIQTEKGVAFQEDQIWKILVDLCSVLKYLHEDQKILHRDLNPANIMIDSNYNLKLADFGLAKRLSGSMEMQQSFVGTLAYSSPEIVQNKPYTEKADIWSLGCIIYELIKLKAPFSGNNPLTMAKNIVNQEYESLEESIPQYSKKLIEFVQQCLTVEEEQRPSIMGLLNIITPQVIDQIKDIKDKEFILNEEVINLTRKISQKTEDTISLKPKVKIESDNLNKIEQDPISKFLQIIQKIAFIANCQTTHKNNFKKFLVDLFYNKIILNLDFHSILLKQEIQKLLNLSKNEITALNIKFDPKANNQGGNSPEQSHKGQQQQQQQQIITYEMMYFYIEELFKVLKKENK